MVEQRGGEPVNYYRCLMNNTSHGSGQMEMEMSLHAAVHNVISIKLRPSITYIWGDRISQLSTDGWSL